MKRKLFFIIPFFLCLFSLGADEVLIIERNFTPEKFHVGDSVLLTMEILNKPGEEFVLPEEIETSETFVLDDITLIPLKDKTEIRIKFRSFEPGSGYTPEIFLGERFLPAVPFYTTPVLSPIEKDLFPVRDQALFPGAKLYTSLIILILIVLPVLLLFLLRYSIKYSVVIIRNYMKKRPFRKFTKLVKKLDVSLVKMEPRVFYSELSEGLKEYLSARAEKDLTSLTTAEIASLQLQSLDRENKKDLVDWLRKSDLIKFAGGKSSIEERRDSLGIITSLCSSVEAGSKKPEDKHAKL